MRRVNAILLLLLFLSASTVVHEILRVPILFTHFLEHSRNDAQISFQDFIVIHYSGDEESDQDFGRHLQLPFKEPQLGEFSISFAVLPDTNGTLEPPERHPLSKGLYEPPRNLCYFQPPIWQPPRI